MFEPMYTDFLAETKTWRTVALLRNSHIELNWDWVTIYLRTADLLVLYQTLDDWFEQDGIWAEAYTVWMGEDRLTLAEDELDEFYELVQTAVDKLPRRTVRWIDIKMRIEPHVPGWHNGPSQFSLN